MNNPAITVLMSAYNGEKYLREAIESILNQTFKDFEFIIINDNSTDRTKKIIEEYAARDERIRLINNVTNLGLTKSLNVGLKEARGEYIARLDADDAALSERLRKQYELMEKNKDITLVGAWAEIIDNNGKTKGFIKGETDEAALAFKMIFSNQIVHSSMFFRKKDIMETGGYNENYPYAQDYELTSRLLKNRRIANQSEVLAKFRSHDKAITKNQEIKSDYQQCALQIIRNNINRWAKIDEQPFDNLAEAIIIKNSTAKLTWKKYRQSKLILEEIMVNFLVNNQIQENSRVKIAVYCKNARRRLIKKLVKSNLPIFYKNLAKIIHKKINDRH